MEEIRNRLENIYQFLEKLLGLSDEKLNLHYLNRLSGIDKRDTRDSVRFSLEKRRIGCFFLPHDYDNILILREALIAQNDDIDFIISRSRPSSRDFLVAVLSIDDVSLLKQSNIILVNDEIEYDDFVFVNDEIVLTRQHQVSYLYDSLHEHIGNLNNALKQLVGGDGIANIELFPLFEDNRVIQAQVKRFLSRHIDVPNLLEILEIETYLFRVISEYNVNEIPVKFNVETCIDAILSGLTFLRSIKKITLHLMNIFAPDIMSEVINEIVDKWKSNKRRFEDFTNKEEIWILSIDGGGIKGALGATILDCIQRDCDKSIHDIFDFFAGTSTGGLKILGLTTPKENGSKIPLYDIEFVRNLYEKDSRDIFPKMMHLEKKFKQLFTYAYPIGPLEKKLIKYYGNLPLHSTTKPAIVSTLSLSEERTVFLKSYDSFENKVGCEIKIWQAARATAAAPTLFAPYTMQYNDTINEFVDGGMTVNNPVLMALLEVKRLCPKLKKVVILSLGSGETGSKHTFGQRNSGLEPTLNIVKIAMRDNNLEREWLVEHLLEMYNLDNNYIRINPEIGKIPMDDPSAENLNKIKFVAENEVRTSPEYTKFINLVKNKQ